MNKPTFGAGEADRTTANVAAPKEKKKLKEIAAVWVKETKNGSKFLSFRVKIDGKEINFRAYKNKHKTDGSGKPDYIALVEED